MPAAYNGVFSLKPSSGRLPFNGIPTNVGESIHAYVRLPTTADRKQAPGQALILTVPGLTGTSVRALRLVMKSLISTEPWREDAAILNIPWRDSLEKIASEKELALGFFEHDGVVVPQPPMARALRMTIGAMERAGHKVLGPYRFASLHF